MATYWLRRRQWLLRLLGQATDNLANKRRAEEYWWNAFQLAKMFAHKDVSITQELEEHRDEYRSRRYEHFPDLWDDEPDESTVGLNENAYLVLTSNCHDQAERDVMHAAYCRDVLLKACWNALAAYHTVLGSFNLQRAPPRRPSSPRSLLSHPAQLGPSSWSSEVPMCD